MINAERNKYHSTYQSTYRTANNQFCIHLDYKCFFKSEKDVTREVFLIKPTFVLQVLQGSSLAQQVKIIT